MFRYRIINFFDTIFKTSIIFLIAFAWCRFYIRDFLPSLLVAVVITLGINTVLSILSNKKQKNLALSREHISQVEQCAIAMQILTDKERIKWLSQMIASPKKTFTKRIEYSKDGKHKVLCYNFSTERINEYDLTDQINSYLGKYDEILVLCHDYTDTAKRLAHSIKTCDIKLLNKYEAYENLYQPANIYPRTEIIKKDVSKLTFRDIMKLFLAKTNAKKYFLSGVFLIFASIVIPYSLYYVIFGSVLLSLSLVCVLLSKKSVSKSGVL